MLRVGEAQFNTLRRTIARNALVDLLCEASLPAERSGEDVVATNALGGETRFTFDDLGFVNGIEPPTGRRTMLTNDREGRPLRIAAPGYEMQFSYGARGKMASASLDGKVLAEFVHDEAGRLRDSIHPDGTCRQIRYDEAGRVISMRDRLGRMERFDWGESGANLRIYDGEGRRTVVEFAGTGLPRSIMLPDGTRETYGYDQDGHLARISLNGHFIVAIESHPTGKPEVLAYADGETVRFTYDGKGRVIEATTNDTVVSYVYDHEGRVVEERQGERVVRYVRGELGTLSELVYPSGASVSFSYGADANPSDVRDWNGGVYRFESARDGEGRSIHYPSGVSEHLVTDGLGRPVSVACRSPEALASFETRTTYDEEGRVAQILDSRLGDRSFDYDAEGQLLAVRSSQAASNERFSYDGACNRVSSGRGSAQLDARNRVLLQGETEYGWDNRGNLIETRGPSGSFRYRYDARNLLIAAEGADGRVISFGYDAFARRVWKRTPEAFHRYLWAGESLIGEEIETAAGKSVREYLYRPGSNAILASRTDGKVHAYHVDHLGTPTQLTGSKGELVWRAEHEAFGRARITHASVRNDARFVGHFFDEETGLHYNRFRYYSPELGRYITQDPVTYLSGLNFYAYAHNDPVNGSDPLGLWGWKSIVSTVAAVAAGIAVTAAIIVTAPVSLPAMAVTAVAVVAGGAAAGAVGFGLNEALNQEKFCLSCILKEALRGMGIGAIAALPFAFLPATAGIAAFAGVGALSGAISYSLDVATNPNAKWSWKDFAMSVGIGAATAGVGRFLAGRYTQWKNRNTIVREDVKPYSTEGKAPGRVKSHVDAEGNVKPANPNGKTTIRQHIRGSEPSKSDSPYTSFKKSDGGSKSYGDNKVRVDVERLKKDIASGKVKDVEVVEHRQVLDDLTKGVQESQARYDANPTPKNLERLEAAQRDLTNATRDQEVLIKGVIPKEYVTVEGPGALNPSKVLGPGSVGAQGVDDGH